MTRFSPSAAIKQTWFHLRWNVEYRAAQWQQREAVAFYEDLFKHGYQPERFILGNP
jgi:hypothetical protein